MRRPKLAIVVMIFVVTACSGEGTGEGTGATVSPDGDEPATTALDTTTTAGTASETTTTAAPETTTTVPETTTTVPPRFDWVRLDDPAFEPSRRGGAFGAVLFTGAGWLAAGHRIDDAGVPQPTTWSSANGSEWSANPLPAPGAGGFINDSAWSGDTGVLVGTIAGAGPTPGLVYRIAAGGSGEIVEADEFAAVMSLSHATADTDGRFLIGGTSGDDAVFYQSANGRRWTVPGRLTNAVNDLDDPSISAMAAGGLGRLLVVEDTRGARDVAVVYVDTGDGFAASALLEDGTDIDVFGAVVTGAQFQIYGAIRGSAQFSPAIWRSGNGADWERIDPDISISDDHTSYNSYGASFRHAVRTSEGLVGVVYQAASYIPVRSTDGTSWSEVPVTVDTRDTEIPVLTHLAAGGDMVLATASSPTQPAMFRITDTAAQVIDDALPAGSDNLRPTAVTATDSGISIAGTDESRPRSLAGDPDQGAVIWDVARDGSVDRSPRSTFEDLWIGGLTLSSSDALVAVGYERFIDRFLQQGTVDPRAWRGSSAAAVTPSEVGTAPDERTVRMNNVTAVGDRLISAGNHFPTPGTTAPIFWFSDDDGRSWNEVTTGAEADTPNYWSVGICALPEGGAIAVGSYDGPERIEPAIWRTNDGGTWSLTANSAEPFGGDAVALSGCVTTPDRVLVVGSTESPSRGAIWETTNGSAFSLLDLPDAGRNSAWWDGAVSGDGRIWVIGRARAGADGAGAALLEIDADGTAAAPVALDGPQFTSPTGEDDVWYVAVSRRRLVLVGIHAGGLGVWMARLPE